MRCLSNLSRPRPASTNPPHRGESNSVQGASVKQTRSVCSERARTPTGGRSRCGFAKRTRGFSAQAISPKWMRCLSNLSRPRPASTNPPNRGESNSRQGAGVKKTPQQRRVGRAFPMAAQAESPSRNPRSDWDVVSGWRLKRKLRPGICSETPGRAFPTAAHDRCGAVNLGRGFFSYPLTADESSGAGITISRHIGVAKSPIPN